MSNALTAVEVDRERERYAEARRTAKSITSHQVEVHRWTQNGVPAYQVVFRVKGSLRWQHSEDMPSLGAVEESLATFGEDAS